MCELEGYFLDFLKVITFYWNILYSSSLIPIEIHTQRFVNPKPASTSRADHFSHGTEWSKMAKSSSTQYARYIRLFLCLFLSLGCFDLSTQNKLFSYIPEFSELSVCWYHPRQGEAHGVSQTYFNLTQLLGDGTLTLFDISLRQDKV